MQNRQHASGAKARFPIVLKIGHYIRRSILRRGFWGVAGASQDWQARIFWEGGIGLGELAEEELRTFSGLDGARVHTRCAKSKRANVCVLLQVRSGGHAQGFAASAGAAAGAAFGDGGGFGLAK